MDVLVLIDKLDDLILNAKQVPLSSQVRVDKSEINDILERMRATIPKEIERVSIDKLNDLILNAKRVPLSSQVRVDRSEIYDILDEMRVAISEEVKQARTKGLY